MTATHSILQQITELSHFLGDPHRDLAILGEGNTSALLDDTLFYVKASGHQLSTIDPSGFCTICFAPALDCLEGPPLTDHELKGALLACKADPETSMMPSVETFFHAYLLTLPGIRFIGHTHPTSVNSILCSSSARELTAGRLFPDEIVVCGIAPCFIDYIDPGIPLAQKIKEQVENYISSYGEPPKTILMQNHGLIALGKTAKEVQNITLMCEKTARILIGSAALGGPKFLSSEAVDRIYTRPDEHYRQRQLGQRT